MSVLEDLARMHGLDVRAAKMRGMGPLTMEGARALTRGVLGVEDGGFDVVKNPTDARVIVFVFSMPDYDAAEELQRQLQELSSPTVVVDVVAFRDGELGRACVAAYRLGGLEAVRGMLGECGVLFGTPRG